MLSNLPASEVLMLIVSVIISLVLHEAMHGFAAHWLGDTTAQDMGRLTLNPLKHIDLITTIILPIVMILVFGIPFLAAKPVPFNPGRLKFGDYGVALVGIAGPITNLLLAVISALILRHASFIPGSLIYNALIVFTEVNIGFFVFNMIPFPPLDGSRLLYAFAPEGLQNFMIQIESAGFLPILIIIFVFYQFISGTILTIENSILNFLFG